MNADHRGTKRLLFARHRLVDFDAHCNADATGEAVLLEGSWPDAASGWRRSLDDAIDHRWSWIEEEASCLAERLGGEPIVGPNCGPAAQVASLAWLDALALRYTALKWLRVIAFFTEVCPLGPYDEIELTVSGRRDEDYVELIERLARQARSRFRVHRVGKQQTLPPGFPTNPLWRRLAGRLAACACPRGGLRRPQRVVLCGNPRILDPVAAEFSRRGAGVWWLYDRFALRSWMRWRPAGVGQLVCDGSLGGSDRLAVARAPSLAFRGIDLSGVADRWLSQRRGRCGPRYTQLLEQIDAHFARVRPTALLLDEDATPMARAAAAIARRHGARSWVVQHGAPCGRFGFAPMAADRIFAWGDSSARRLQAWGVPAEQIRVTGSPWHDRLHESLAPLRLRPKRAVDAACGPQILLLTTVPPRDGRPDMISHHLTGRTYAEMVRIALAAVAKVPGVRLIVKLHPRSDRDPVVDAMLKRFPSIRGRVVRRGSLTDWLAGSDLVLSCLSSAGVDATLAGVPVIQLLPQGSVDVLPHADWGMVGTARTAAELDRLLARALSPEASIARQSAAHVFGDFRRPAAARIADAVFAPAPVAIPAPHFLPLPLAGVDAVSEDAAFSAPMTNRG